MGAPGELAQALSDAVAPWGIDLVAAVPAARWDASLPPDALRAGSLLDGARAFVVVGSSGRGGLWRAFRGWAAEAPRDRLRGEPHPLDRFVAAALDAGDALLAARGVRARRFEPTFAFQPRLDFQRLAELAGLGSPSPIGMLIHPQHGPWWGARGAWLIDCPLDESAPLDGAPCRGCPAPCRAAIPPGSEGTLAAATRGARAACVLDGSRYGDEQLDYHYGGVDARLRLADRLEAERP
jgi:hypothetical protein